jgi:N-acetylmuramoyl-L-alanine amidase
MMNIIQNYLPFGDARPGADLDNVLAIILHWPAAPGQTAEQTRNFWASADNTEGSSAHCVIDQDGSIQAAIPWHERAYHVGSSLVDPVSGKIYTDLARQLFGDYAANPKTTSPNHVTIGIEMATTDNLGTYTDATVTAAIELCAYLCEQYHLDPLTKIIRHYDVVGWKKCPAWYVAHPEDLIVFRQKAANKMADAS